MRLIAVRTAGRLAGQGTTVFAVAAYAAVSGAFFASGLFSAEGVAVSLQSVWAVAASKALPVLAALLSMRLWEGSGDSAGDEINLVAPVAERHFAAGRFLGAYAAMVAGICVSFAVPLFALPHCAPALDASVSVFGFIPAAFALCVYAIPLAAIASFCASVFRRAAPSAVASAVLCGAVPHVVYSALAEWSPAVRRNFAEMPLEALVADGADGCISLGTVAGAAAIAVFAVFAASKSFAMRRLVGGGNRVLKFSSVFAVASGLLAVSLFVSLAYRLDVKLVLPGGAREAVFSARTREILSAVPHEVRVIACIGRNSREFVPLSRLLRAVAAESRTVAGAGVTCEFVDPRWDLADARLSQAGVGEGTVLFVSGNRRIAIPAEGLDEGACASAIQRLSMPVRSERILFTAGHGEPSIDDYGPAGASDAARALRQDGYRVDSLFTATSSIPADCSVLVVSGARTPFSSAELRGVEMFLAQGGHVMSTLSRNRGAGISPLLEARGVAAAGGATGAPTMGGSDVVVTEFGDHAVSAPLSGTAVLLSPEAVNLKTEETRGMDGGFEHSPLCIAGEGVYAIASEKGSSLKSDLAIRPARAVVVGDDSFLRNSSVSSRANANRDLLLNSVAWLSGLDVSGSANISASVLSPHLDRSGRIAFVAWATVAVPGAAALAGILLLAWKRRRT